MKQEIGPEHFWNRENPLGVRDIGENFVLKQLGEDCCTLGPTGWTEASAFAGERYEKLEATPRANDAGET